VSEILARISHAFLEIHTLNADLQLDFIGSITKNLARMKALISQSA
jgi:hypothetical protein